MLTKSFSEQAEPGWFTIAGSRIGWAMALGLCLCLLAGCSVRKMAVNKLGDALAESGTTFASDDDPELVKAAVPFALKLMESLLGREPGT